MATHRRTSSLEHTKVLATPTVGIAASDDAQHHMPGSRLHTLSEIDLVKLKNIYEIPAWARMEAIYNISTAHVEGMLEVDVSFEILTHFLDLRDVYMESARN